MAQDGCSDVGRYLPLLCVTLSLHMLTRSVLPPHAFRTPSLKKNKRTKGTTTITPQRLRHSRRPWCSDMIRCQATRVRRPSITHLRRQHGKMFGLPGELRSSALLTTRCTASRYSCGGTTGWSTSPGQEASTTTSTTASAVLCVSGCAHHAAAKDITTLLVESEAVFPTATLAAAMGHRPLRTVRQTRTRVSTSCCPPSIPSSS